MSPRPNVSTFYDLVKVMLAAIAGGRPMGATARALVAHASRAAARVPWAPRAAAPAARDRRLACPSTLGLVELRCASQLGSVVVRNSANARRMSGIVGSGATGGVAGPGEAAGAARIDKFFDVTGANFAQVVNDRCVHATQGEKICCTVRKYMGGQTRCIPDDSPAHERARSTVPVIIVCYAPEEGGVSDTVRRKFETQVSSVPGVMLGRLDVEQQQELAMNLQLAEIPTVFAIHNKKVVNKISGNLNDTEIAGFVANCSHLARLAAGEGQVQEAAELLTQGHVAEALEVYGAILKNGKEHSDVVRASALAGMGMCAVSLNDLEGAKGIATLLRAEYKLLLEVPVV